MKARIWKQDGAWEYDVRDDRPPRLRATGTCRTWESALASVLGELRYMAGRLS